MPTAMNVKEEKIAKTNIVRFETSTSPNWKDIKIHIIKIFLNINTIAKNFSEPIINSEKLQYQKLIYR